MNAVTEAPALAAAELELIPLDVIAPSQTHIQTLRRRHFNPERLLELAQSIKEVGVLQPIVVRPAGEASRTLYAGLKPKYEIVAGERRYLAAQRAGLAHIPATVRDLTDAQVLEVQLIENLQRDELSALEEAEGYAELMKLKGINADEVATLIGKSRSYVYARRKLLDLIPAAREAFAAGAIDASKALLLARFKGEALQEKALKVLTESNWRGESVSYKAAFSTLREKFMIPLATAPFDLGDASLFRFEKVPGRRIVEEPIALPACFECPHFSGNDVELKRELGDAHVCTDSACYDAKVKDHARRRKDSVERLGLTVITGEEAKKIAPRKDKLVGHVDLDDPVAGMEFEDVEPFPDLNGKDEDIDELTPEEQARIDAYDRRREAWTPPSYRKLLEGEKLDVVLLEDPKTKRIRELVPLKAVKPLLAKKHDVKLPSWLGAPEPKPQQNTQVDWKEEQRKREERAAKERAWRKKLLEAIAPKAVGPLKREEIVDIADSLIEQDSWALKEALVPAIYPKLPEPGQLKDAELGKFIRLALVADDVARTFGGGPTALLALAKRYKVDVAKIKKQLDDEAKGKAAPAAEASAKKSKPAKKTKRK